MESWSTPGVVLFIDWMTNLPVSQDGNSAAVTSCDGASTNFLVEAFPGATASNGVKHVRSIICIAQERYRLYRSDNGSHFRDLFRAGVRQVHSECGLPLPDFQPTPHYGYHGSHVVEHPHEELNRLLRVFLGFKQSDFIRSTSDAGLVSWRYIGVGAAEPTSSKVIQRYFARVGFPPTPLYSTIDSATKNSISNIRKNNNNNKINNINDPTLNAPRVSAQPIVRPKLKPKSKAKPSLAESPVEEDDVDDTQPHLKYWDRTLLPILRVMEDAAKNSYDGFNMLQLHRGRGSVPTTGSIQYTVDIATSVAEDVSSFASTRRLGLAARENSRIEANLRNLKKNLGKPSTDLDIGMGSIVQRARVQRSKHELYRIKDLFVVTRRNTSSAEIERLDGRKHRYGNPVTLGLLSIVTLSDDQIVSYVIAALDNDVQRAHRISELVDLEVFTENPTMVSLKVPPLRREHIFNTFGSLRSIPPPSSPAGSPDSSATNTIAVFSFNLDGLRAVLRTRGRCGMLYSIFAEEPALVCFQETKIRAEHECDYEMILSTLFPLYKFVFSSSQLKLGYSGVGFGIRRSLRHSVLEIPNLLPVPPIAPLADQPKDVSIDTPGGFNIHEFNLFESNLEDMHFDMTATSFDNYAAADSADAAKDVLNLESCSPDPEGRFLGVSIPSLQFTLFTLYNVNSMKGLRRFHIRKAWDESLGQYLSTIPNHWVCIGDFNALPSYSVQHIHPELKETAEGTPSTSLCEHHSLTALANSLKPARLAVPSKYSFYPDIRSYRRGAGFTLDMSLVSEGLGDTIPSVRCTGRHDHQILRQCFKINAKDSETSGSANRAIESTEEKHTPVVARQSPSASSTGSATDCQPECALGKRLIIFRK